MSPPTPPASTRSKLDFLLAPPPATPPSPSPTPSPLPALKPTYAPAPTGPYDTRAQSNDSLQTTDSRERHALAALSLTPDALHWDARRRRELASIRLREHAGVAGASRVLSADAIGGAGAVADAAAQRAYSYDSAPLAPHHRDARRALPPPVEDAYARRAYDYRSYAPARPNGFQAARADSGISNVTPVSDRAGSGGSGSGASCVGMPLVGPASAGSRSRTGFKSEAEIRDKREQRRMKNRISAARSRQRKTDTFETLQRELGEAKNVIEALTIQLANARGGAAGSVRGAGPSIAVPHDLRHVIGRDYVSADGLMDLLRMYIHRSVG